MRIAICSFWYLVGWAIGALGLYRGYNYFVEQQGINLFYSFDKLLLFHCGVSALAFVIILAVHLKRPQYTAFGFVAGFVLRLIAIIFFLFAFRETHKLSTPIRTPLYHITYFLFYNLRNLHCYSIDKNQKIDYIFFIKIISNIKKIV